MKPTNKGAARRRQPLSPEMKEALDYLDTIAGHLLMIADAVRRRAQDIRRHAEGRS